MKRIDRRALALSVVLAAAGVFFPTAVLAQAVQKPVASGSAQPEQDVWNLLREAQSQKQAGRCDDAIRLYTRILDSAPTLVSALRGRADCLANAEQREAAAADYREVIRHWPADAQAWGRLGWSLMVLGRFAEAQEASLKAQKLEPLNYAWEANVGHTYLLLQGDADKAREHYRRALEAVANDTEFRDGLLPDFDLFVKKGWSMALVARERDWMQSEFPRYQRHRDALAAIERAGRLTREGNREEAAKVWIAALELTEATFGAEHPRTAAAIDSLALLNRSMSRNEEALRLFQRSLAIREKVLGIEHLDVASSLNNLAALYRSMGRYSEALALYQRSLAIVEKSQGDEHPAVAASLNSLALVYQSMGQYARALPLQQRSLAIRQKALDPEHQDVATSLNNLAGTYQALARYAEALPLYQRSLVILEKIRGPAHPDVATNLNNLAHLYDSMGRYIDALPLYQRSLAIRENALGAEHSSVAESLNNLAELYRSMGEYARALPLYQRSLAILEKVHGPEHPIVAASLNNLALLQSAMGRYMDALPLFQRSLAISEKALGPEHPDVANSLNNLASLYVSMGRYADALPLFQRSLAIREKTFGVDHPAVAIALNNFALLYESMGRYADALPLHRRSLAISEKALGPEHPDVAASLNSLAGLSFQMGRYAEALPLYQRSLAIYEKVHGSEHPTVAIALNNLAVVYEAMRRYADALNLYQRSLAIKEKALGVEHPDVALSLHNLAVLHWHMGRRDEAFALWQRALPIVSRGDLPEYSWQVRAWLRQAFSERGQTDLAIYWGKQAVDTIQHMRSNLTSLDRELQRSFLQDKRGVYTKLADLLVGAGRLAEGQEVLGMLKEEELYDFQRRAPEADPRKTAPTFTGAEVGWQQRFAEVSGQLGSLGRELDELRRKAKFGLSEAEQARRTQIEADLKVAQQAFAVFLAQMEQDVARISQADRERARAIDERRLGRVRELQATLSQLGHGAVALHYLVTDERVRIIVTLPTTQIGREAAIAAADLNRLIQDFRSVLQNPKADPRPLAQKLYAVLIAPVAQDLAQFNARMLMLSLDDRLRYIPFAALYDGQQYLIERYQMALLTEASRDKLRDRPEAHWRLAGLGLTQGVKVPGIGTLREAQSFSALPEVRRELEAIVKTDAKGSSGVLPGEVQFDAQFTEATLQRLLDAGYPVLHLASHFQFRPGSDDASYLVLGNGQSLSLAELKGERFNFQNIDLLTLSACETAVGGGKDANGQEIEGFGALAQIKGARGVLASLWKVADTSTATLMVLTYRNREEGQLTKAEALQQAQLALLRGAQTASDATAARGATRTPAAAQTAAAPAFATDPKVPFAHPFYWAPFILMGNWL